MTTAPQPVGLHAELMQRYGVGARYADAYLEYWTRSRGRTYASLDEILAGPAPEPMWFDFAMSANWRGDRLVERLRPLIPQGARRYLDVGCGFGGYLVAFARLGLDVSGIEIDRERIDLARANLADAGLGERVHAASILEPDLARRLGTFDLITCIDVIEHVADVPTAIARMAELLRPGGLLVLEIPNAEAAAFVASDGHFGLFGITLLDREDARAYHRRFFSDDYDVGEYLPLPAYRARFAALGCSTQLLDPPPPEQPRDGAYATARGLLQAWRRHRADRHTALPRALRRILARRFAAYLARFVAAGARGALVSGAAQSFQQCFVEEFWTLLVARPAADAPAGS